MALAGCAEIPIPDPAVGYIAFGDSSAAGPAERDYPDILREMLGESPEAFANEAKSGESADEGLERLRLLLSLDIYPNAHTLLYWEGAGGIIDFITEVDGLLLRSPNDSNYPYTSQLNERLDNIQTHIESAIQAAQEKGLKVYIATYFFSPEIIAHCDRLLLNTILPLQARNANTYIELLNGRIRQSATKKSAILVDIAAADTILRADNANYSDCSHLSTAGNTIVADLFLKAIQ
ncbi:MAG: SGNH/GDSL hydrolase family protein [Planctomycetota bacterium]